MQYTFTHTSSNSCCAQGLTDGRSSTRRQEKSVMKDPILVLLSCTETHLSASPVDESSMGFGMDYDMTQVAVVFSLMLHEESQSSVAKCPSQYICLGLTGCIGQQGQAQ